jgi:hypothetical protein
MVEKLEIVDRFGSWGTANLRRKSLIDVYGKENVLIFKEMTKSPFTAFLNNQYVVMIRRHTREK